MNHQVFVSSTPFAGGEVTVQLINPSWTVLAFPNSGWRFNGWFENGVLRNSSATWNFTPTQTTHLVAQFVADTPTSQRVNLILHTNPFEGGHLSGGGSFEANTWRTVEAFPNSGWQFDGWFRNNVWQSSNPSHTLLLGNSDIHLTAHFSPGGWTPPPVGFQVTVTAANGGRATGTGRFNPNTQATVTATPNEGWVFDGWFENNVRVPEPEAEATWRFPVTRNRTLQARFTALPFEITATAGAGGRVTGGGTFPHSTLITLTATPNPNWLFDGWFENGVRVPDAEAEWEFRVTGNRVLEARFSLRRVTITATADVGGSVTGGGTFNHGQTVTLRAIPLPTPNTDWAFRNTSSNGTAVVVSAGGGFAGSRLYCLPATAQTLTVPQGWLFDGWYENDEKIPNAPAMWTFQAERNMVIEARFVKSTATRVITYSAGGGTGQVPSPQTFEIGEPVVIPGCGNLRRSDEFFDGWRVDSTDTLHFPGNTATFNNNVTLVAQWMRFSGEGETND